MVKFFIIEITFENKLMNYIYNINLIIKKSLRKFK